MSILSLFLLSACGTPIEHQDWEVAEQRVQSDACGVWQDSHDPQDTGMLEFKSGPSGLLLDLGMEQPVHCADDGIAVHCVPVAMEQSMSGSLLGTSITLDAFRVSESTLQGTYSLGMSCQGAMCAAWEDIIQVDFPCTSQVEFTAFGYSR